MQGAFGVHDPQIVTDDDWTAWEALRELVLLPDRCARRLVECLDRPFVVRDVEIAVIEREAAQAAEVPRPGRRATLRVEAGDAAKIGRCTDLPFLDHRQARDVCESLELGRALGRSDVPLPRKCARGNVDPQQLPAGRTREQPAAGDDTAGVAAHGKGRRRAHLLIAGHKPELWRDP